jgi:hypothetical protein
MLSRDLNNALQCRLAEYKLSSELLPEIPSVIRHYLSNESSREITVKRLERVLGPHVTDIPRVGARGGYAHVGTPSDRLHFLIDDIMAILDSGKIRVSNKA